MPALALMLGLLIAQDGDFPAKTALPASLQPGALVACAPVTLDAAEECLRNAVSAEDRAIMLDRLPARRFRPQLDCEVQNAWRLADPASPMAKVMDGLLGVHVPGFAASMIISDMQSRSKTGPLPFDEIRPELAKHPLPASAASVCPSAQS